MNAAWITGYCTNVHAGTRLQQIRDNLDRVAVDVRAHLALDTLGVGLWIPELAASELQQPGAVAEFSRWLDDRGLIPMTINGFPQGDFHQAVVKHRVYQPTWWDDARREHTLQLIDILHGILPGQAIGSISTLPIAWGTPGPSEAQWQRAVANLRTISERLHQIEQESGRRIVLAIEPEPGCAIDVTDDMIAFFERYFPDASERRYLTVCHDVCHAAVMYEEQAAVLERYAASGIGIGKVQVSSAIEVPWDRLTDASDRAATWEQLHRFAEDRYLHQTVRHLHDGSHRLVEDLPQLLNQHKPDAQAEHSEQAATTIASTDHNDRSWRIHFHVPIYLQSFGNLLATGDAVGQCLASLKSIPGLDFTGHLEVETYAWSVLPADMAPANLAQAISKEVAWLNSEIGRI